MIFTLKKAAVFALLIATSCSLNPAHANDRAEFTRVDQPFVYFKAIANAKYPWMFRAQPGINQVDTLLFGTAKGDRVKLVKSPTDLATLVPIQCEFKDADASLVYKQIYKGKRDSYFGVAFENLFKLFGLLSSNGYKGTPLVDEYKEGMPMKWVFSTVDQFKGIKRYMRSHLRAFVPSEQKPLLLLEIVKPGQVLDADDMNFLNTYFEVCDPLDNHVKNFFNETQKTLGDMLDKTLSAKQVGQSVGEAVFELVENHGYIKGFDTEKLTPVFLGLIGGMIIQKATAPVQAGITGNSVYQSAMTWITDKCNADNMKKLAIAGGSVAALVILYNLWLDYCVQDCELVDLEENLEADFAQAPTTVVEDSTVDDVAAQA